MAHTRRQLQELLFGAGLRPVRKLGQNFLVDLNLMRLLVDSADLSASHTVLEVGCGTGSLTSLLAERCGAVVAVDIDAELVRIAECELIEYDNVTIICRDILAAKSAICPEVISALNLAQAELAGPLLLVANLPYHIAGPLIVNLLLSLAAGPFCEGMFVTVQSEVADRMTAAAGCKSYGLLSILMQSTGSIERLRSIGPQSFWPSPQVDSAMIAWRLDRELLGRLGDIRHLKRTIDILLGHRRKKIGRALALAGMDERALESVRSLGIDLNQRGESLSPAMFVDLSNALIS